MILFRGPQTAGSRQYRVVPAASKRAIQVSRGLGAMVSCPVEYISADGKCCNFIDEFGQCVGEAAGQTITAPDGTRRQIFDTYEIVTDPRGNQTVRQLGVTNVTVRPGSGGFDLTKFVNDHSTHIVIGSVLFVGVLFLFRK